MATTAKPFVPNSLREIRANGERRIGSFRRGNSRAAGSRDDRSTLLETDDRAYERDGSYVLVPGRFGTGLPLAPTPVVAAAKPYADTPFEPRLRRARKTYVCPGCGIVPPKARKCDNCWD